jgi:curved DNA-binding protein CbpA
MTVADPRRSYYKVLMLDPSADRDVISAVYRRLAQRYHPDRDASPEAARRMSEINEAYGVLKDPVRRLEYDRELQARQDRRSSDRLVYRPGDVAFGEAGSPVGPPDGSVIDFGRYRGWTLGQIRRTDPDFLEWLMRAPAGRQYRREIETLLARRV